MEGSVPLRRSIVKHSQAVYRYLNNKSAPLPEVENVRPELEQFYTDSAIDWGSRQWRA